MQLLQLGNKQGVSEFVKLFLPKVDILYFYFSNHVICSKLDMSEKMNLNTSHLGKNFARKRHHITQVIKMITTFTPLIMTSVQPPPPQAPAQNLASITQGMVGNTIHIQKDVTNSLISTSHGLRLTVIADLRVDIWRQSWTTRPIYG